MKKRNECKNVEDMAKVYPDFVVKYEDFQFIKSVGKGGFSEVFSAIYTETGQTCAVKKLKCKDLDGEKFISFYREIDILSKCKHPFLLGFLGFSTKRPYIVVTEYLPGGSLYDALRWKEKSLTGTQKTIIAMCIANGMQRLHKLKIVHRDLKSLNILLDANLLPRVIDFGLSTQLEEGHREEFLTTTVGTPHWMAPELFESQPYTNKIDVYAYGMLLWEILTQQTPYPGKSSSQIMYDVCNKQKRPPIPMRTPSALKALINQCWAQDPNDRPTFKEIYRAFASNKVVFDGTNRDDVASIVTKIKIIKHNGDQIAKLQFATGTLQNDGTIGSQIDMSIDDQSDSQINWESIMDPSSPNFDASLSDISSNLPSDYSEMFFTIISEKYFKQDTPENIVLSILTAVDKLISSDEYHYKSFLSKKIYSKINLQNEKYSQPLLDIFRIFIANSPLLLSEEHIQTIQFYADTQPQKVLRLINIYSCNKACNKASIQKFWTVTDLLFQKNEAFMKNGAGVDLARLLHTLVKLFPKFYEARGQYVNLLLNNLIAMGRKEAATALDVICAELSIKIPVPENLVQSLLSNDQLVGRILTMILRNESEPSDNVLSYMLNEAQYNPLVTYALCQLCLKESTAKRVAQMGQKWLTVGLPDIENTIRLLMVISEHKEASVLLPIDVARTLNEAASKPGDAFNAIFPILLNMSISKELYQSLGDQFIENYFSTTFQQSNSDLIVIALKIVEILSRGGFSSGFVTILPYLAKMLGSEGWDTQVVPALSALSYIPEMKQPLLNAGVLNQVIQINDESVDTYKQIIVSNLS